MASMTVSKSCGVAFLSVLIVGYVPVGITMATMVKWRSREIMGGGKREDCQTEADSRLVQIFYKSPSSIGLQHSTSPQQAPVHSNHSYHTSNNHHTPATMKTVQTLTLLFAIAAGISALPSENNPSIDVIADGKFTYTGQSTVRTTPSQSRLTHNTEPPADNENRTPSSPAASRPAAARTTRRTRTASSGSASAPPAMAATGATVDASSASPAPAVASAGSRSGVSDLRRPSGRETTKCL